MAKFSISTLLWIIAVIAIITAVIITQKRLSEKETELAIADKQIASYREELGHLDVDDPSHYYIRHFQDRYTSDTEFRWRIHVPDASKCTIFYSVGKLPQTGIPENRQQIATGRLPQGTAELVVVAESRESKSGRGGDFRIGFFPEYEEAKFFPSRGTKMRTPSWMPWFRGTKCIFENPPLDSTTEFSLDQPFTIMKHYTIDDDGDMVGYMFWIEEANSLTPGD